MPRDGERGDADQAEEDGRRRGGDGDLDDGAVGGDRRGAGGPGGGEERGGGVDGGLPVDAGLATGEGCGVCGLSCGAGGLGRDAVGVLDGAQLGAAIDHQAAQDQDPEHGDCEEHGD